MIKRLKVPTSKSQTMRALLFALLAEGESTLENLLDSPDKDQMIAACRELGAVITTEGKLTKVVSPGIISDKKKVIYAGNSGQVFRFMGAISALSSGKTYLDGDDSLRHLRPISAFINALKDLGVQVEGNQAPLILEGPFKSSKVRMDGSDSQPVSALIMAGAFSPRGMDIEVENSGELPWIALTLSWLDRFKIGYTVDHSEDRIIRYRIPGGAKISGFNYKVPTDFSSLASPLTYALVQQVETVIEDIQDDSFQGDKKFIDVVQQMGAKLEWRGDCLHIYPSSLKGISIDLNPIIDMAPLLSVLGCFAEGKTTLYNGKIARSKESDRLLAMSTELNKMGGNVLLLEDGLEITPQKLYVTDVSSYEDHRIAMALAIATDGKNHLQEASCIKKSYPGFSRLF